MHHSYDDIRIKIIIHGSINQIDEHYLHRDNFLVKKLWVEVVSHYGPCQNFERIKSSPRNLVSHLLEGHFNFLRLLLLDLNLFNLPPNGEGILLGLLHDLFDLALLGPVNLEEHLNFLNLFS